MRKRALIIGGSSGIGKATALNLLSQDVVVHVVGTNSDKLTTFKNEAKGHLVTHKVDITNKTEVTELNRQISEFDNLDYLVNASGIFGPKAFLDHTEADYDSYLDLNRGFFFITQAASKKMAETSGGAIVNVGSMWAKQAIKATPSSAYSMQKAGLHSLTQHLAMELADHKIRVNAVSPGTIDTPFHAQIKSTKPEVFASWKNNIMLGRLGEPQEVASVVSFLASTDASFITAETIQVGGGQALGI